MSIQSVSNYFEQLAKNGETLKSAITATSAEDVVKAVLRDGAARGFEFTERDLIECLQARHQKSGPNGELNDQQLEAVAGGDDWFSRWLPQEPWYAQRPDPNDPFQKLLDDALNRSGLGRDFVL